MDLRGKILVVLISVVLVLVVSVLAVLVILISFVYFEIYLWRNIIDSAKLCKIGFKTHHLSVHNSVNYKALRGSEGILYFALGVLI